jgi:hypothetical protein
VGEGAGRVALGVGPEYHQKKKRLGQRRLEGIAQVAKYLDSKHKGSEFKTPVLPKTANQKTRQKQKHRTQAARVKKG